MAEDPVIEISNVHPTLRLGEEEVEALAQRVVDGEGAEIVFLSIILADHATVHQLNRDFLQHDYETDVLSFPLDERPGLVDGEVYVDLDTAAERAPEFGATFDQEARRYVVHGLLHLLGYDDASPEGKAQMHMLEDRYL